MPLSRPSPEEAPPPDRRRDTCTTDRITGGLDADQAATLARTLKALADPARLRLLSLVVASPTGEACVCDLTESLGLSQPTVSHHLKVLVDAGFLSRDKRGVWAWFSPAPGAMDAVTAALPGALAAAHR